MAKYRVVTAEWQTPFGEMRRTPAVQVRAGFFWWVTLTHCETVKQAATYIQNVQNRKPEKVLGVIVK